MHFRWSCLPDMTQKRDCVPGIVWTKVGLIVVAGGSINDNRSSSVEAFTRPFSAFAEGQPTTRKWLPLAPMRVARSNLSLCELGRCILAVGGYDGTNHVSTVEALILSPKLREGGTNRGQWTTICPMTRVMNVHGLVVRCSEVWATSKLTHFFIGKMAAKTFQ